MNYNLDDIARLFGIHLRYTQVSDGWEADWIVGLPVTLRSSSTGSRYEVRAIGKGATKEAALRDLVKRLDEDNPDLG